MVEIDAKGEVQELKVRPSMKLVEWPLTPNHRTRSTEWSFNYELSPLKSHKSRLKSVLKASLVVLQ